MIVRKDKTYETNSLFPGINWYEDEENYVIDETKEENQELIQKIKEHSPYMELVIEYGELVDIIPTERPSEQEPNLPEKPTIEELQEQVLELQEYILEQEYEKLLNQGGM